jgi:hypothetical protein
MVAVQRPRGQGVFHAAFAISSHAQTRASPSSTQRVATRLIMKPQMTREASGTGLDLSAARRSQHAGLQRHLPGGENKPEAMAPTSHAGRRIPD